MKKVLIIGTGGIGKRHIRGFLKTGRVTLSICESDEKKRKEVAQSYPVVKEFADFSKVTLSDFDACVICTPAHLHVAMAKRCADAGVPFLLEKPLSVTMEGVDQLIETAAEKGIPARVGYVLRSTPWYIRVKQDIDQGRAGDLRMAYINISQNYPKYRPDFQKIYYAKAASGGGAILDGASHLVDILLWVMGPVTEVSAMYDRLVLEKVECEDSALISLRFASGPSPRRPALRRSRLRRGESGYGRAGGAMAQIAINQFQKPNVITTEFIGTRGNLKVDGTRAQLLFSDNDSGIWEIEDFVKNESFMEIHEGNFFRQANSFLDILDSRPDCLATLSDARENLRIVHAAKQSYKDKKIISL